MSCQSLENLLIYQGLSGNTKKEVLDIRRLLVWTTCFLIAILAGNCSHCKTQAEKIQCEKSDRRTVHKVPSENTQTAREIKRLASRGLQARLIFRGTASGYSPGDGHTPSDRTASGTRAVRGAIAVDKRLVRRGVKLYVTNYGLGVARDTGVVGKHVDLCFDKPSQAKKFGRRQANVYEVKKVPIHVARL